MEASLLTFGGAIIVAALTYIFGRRLEHERHLQGLRTQSYVDYLKSVCERAQLGPLLVRGSRESQEISLRTADAKSRICLYGSPVVIAAFAHFEKLGATMNTSAQRLAFVEVTVAMRADSGRESAELEHIELILLGPPVASA